MNVYVVTTPRGFTESFDERTIQTLLNLDLIEFERAEHVIVGSGGKTYGPLHCFYRETKR